MVCVGAFEGILICGGERSRDGCDGFGCEKAGGRAAVVECAGGGDGFEGGSGDGCDGGGEFEGFSQCECHHGQWFVLWFASLLCCFGVVEFGGAQLLKVRVSFLAELEDEDDVDGTGNFEKTEFS